MENRTLERTWAQRGFIVTLLTVIAVALLFPQLTRADQPEAVENPNFAFSAEAAKNAVPYDVSLPPDVDLDAYVRETLNRGPEAYLPPLMVPAADASADSQTSPYFFSFGSGSYNYSTSSSCHMAPVYLPFTGGGVTVTLDNFFIFALDNGTSDTTYNLWRKATSTTAGPQLMGSVSTSGALSTVQVLGDTTIDNAQLSSAYVYYITWCFGGTAQAIQGFWLYYTES